MRLYSKKRSRLGTRKFLCNVLKPKTLNFINYNISSLSTFNFQLFPIKLKFISKFQFKVNKDQAKPNWLYSRFAAARSTLLGGFIHTDPTHDSAKELATSSIVQETSPQETTITTGVLKDSDNSEFISTRESNIKDSETREVGEEQVESSRLKLQELSHQRRTSDEVSIEGDLNEISTAIKGITNSMIEELPELDVKISQDLVDNFKDTLLINTAEVMFKKNRNVRELLYLAFSSSICATIFQTVFRRFKHGLNDEEEKIISSMHSKIKLIYPQDMIAIWRSMSYDSTSSDLIGNLLDTEKANLICNSIFTNLYSLLQIISPQTSYDLNSYRRQMSKIALRTLEWKDRISSNEALEHDFEAITIPFDEDFASDKEMESLLENNGEILGVVAFGLRRIARYEDAQGEIQSEVKVVEWPELKWEKDY